MKTNKNKKICIKTENGNLYLPPSLEIKHTLAVGAVGSGKSQFISQVIENLIRRGDKAVILDLKGEFTSYFYRPGIDMILNPLDTRSIKWSIANDINFDLLQADAEVISNSLINDLSAQSENEKFFLTAGKNVVRGLVYYALSRGKKTNKELSEIIFSEYEKIKEMLASIDATAALSALGEKRGAQADGVIATAHTWSRAIELLADSDGGFCITDWIKSDKGGLIFLNASQKYQNIVSPLARFFVDFLLNILLGLGQDLNRRVFIVLDEFQNLSAIPSLLSILALGRSAGAAVIAGTQDFGLIDQKYGQNAKTTLVNAMNTLVIMKIIEPNTADYLSRALGESEIEDYSTSSSLSMDESWDRVNIAANRRQERLVLPLEMSALKPLEFYIKCLEYIGKLKLELVRRKPVQPDFLPIKQAIISKVEKKELNLKKGVEKNAEIEKSI